MPVFKFVISHGKQSVQVEKDQKDAPVFGKKIGDTIGGEFLGLVGYELQITGGSDRDGFPMLKDAEGQMRKKQILTRGTGFHTKVEGKRKRRIVRGNTISTDISQVNCRVVKAGEKSMFELLGKTPKEPKAKTKMEKKEEAKTDAAEKLETEKGSEETKAESTQTEIKDEKKGVEDTQDVADVATEEKDVKTQAKAEEAESGTAEVKEAAVQE